LIFEIESRPLLKIYPVLLGEKLSWDPKL